MNDISNNNVSFTSVIKVRNINSNAKRWESIGKLIQDKTKKFDDYIVISGDANDKNKIQIDAFTSPKLSMGGEHVAIIPQNESEILMKKSDEFIAGKIIKFIKICRKQDQNYDTASKFCQKFNTNKENGDEFTEKFWDLIVDKAVSDFKKSVGKDNQLKKFEYLG